MFFKIIFENTSQTEPKFFFFLFAQWSDLISLYQTGFQDQVICQTIIIWILLFSSIPILLSVFLFYFLIMILSLLLIHLWAYLLRIGSLFLRLVFLVHHGQIGSVSLHTQSEFSYIRCFIFISYHMAYYLIISSIFFGYMILAITGFYYRKKVMQLCHCLGQVLLLFMSCYDISHYSLSGLLELLIIWYAYQHMVLLLELG